MVLVYKEIRITEIMSKQKLLIRILSLVLIKQFSLEVLVAYKLLKPNHYLLLSTQNFYYPFDILH